MTETRLPSSENADTEKSKAAQLDKNTLERRLVTIASGKGGVGKTWLSVTLSQILAQQGRKIALFDGDLGLANVDIQLGLTPEKDLSHVISGDAGFKDIVTRYENKQGQGFDVLPGQSGTGALGVLSREALINVRHKLTLFARDYDHLLLDLAAGIDQSVMTLSNHRGILLIVMTGDPTSLTDAYAMIKVSVARNPKANVNIVVNNVADRAAGEKAFSAIKRACEGFLRVSPKFVGVVRQDPKVVDAIRAQTPLLSRHPDAPAIHDVKALAKILFDSPAGTG